MSELATVIETHVHNALTNTYTAMPAKVIKVNKKGDTITTLDCRPAFHGIFRDGISYEQPEIYSVPPIFPSAGGGIISFPVKEGDTVLLVFSMYDIDNFMQGDLETTPKTRRFHNMTDAVAIVGLYPTDSNLEPSTENTEIKFAGSKVSIAPNGNMTLEAPTVKIVGDTKMEGNLDIKGDVTNNGYKIGHEHVHIDSAGGNTQEVNTNPLNEV